MKTVTVRASRTYDILIDKGLLSHVGEHLTPLHPAPAKVMIVTDDTVNALWGDTVEKSLVASGYTVFRFVVPHGEESKSTETLVSLWNALARAGLTRTDLIVALGGGVVGDMAGFAAATYLRGIEFLQCPTTLLSMVDSSVGGKTGVDLEAGKNLCGAFHQPIGVLCDTNALSTLPDATFADGCAEVIKYGYIGNPALLSLLEKPFADDPDEVIAMCVSDKRDVVEEDEHDHGSRQLLNLGHTSGHAIEGCSHFEISHGSAVAIGMLLMARAAVKKGLCEADVPTHMEALLRAYHLPVDCPFTAEELVRVALSDKKRKGNSITLVLPLRVGKSRLHRIPADELLDFFAAGL